MDGYDERTYGDRFADVYDEWYGDITHTDDCVEALARLAAGGPVLELGVGTGRLAVPLAARGLAVTGVDASAAMLAAMAAKPGGDAVTAIEGDMADPPVGAARFALVFVAYNTLFNLVADGAQQRCLDRAAERLTPDGRFVVEAFVPDGDLTSQDVVAPRQVTADKVVLSVSRSRPATQELLGQYVDITEAGIRLRPWHLRWATPTQLDERAEAAGLRLVERWAGWRNEPFDAAAATHVSVYQRR